MPEVVVSENTPALFFRDQLIAAMEPGAGAPPIVILFAATDKGRRKCGV